MKLMTTLLAFALTGCATPALWNPDFETEYVSGFYVNPERNELLVSTRDISYVFPVDDETVTTILLSQQVAFRLDIGDFYIDEEGNASGSFYLYHEAKTAEPLRSQLADLGFVDKPAGAMLFSKEISGRRYQLEGELPLEKLDEEYPVRVAYPDTGLEIAGKMLATPVAVAYDTYVVVPAAFVGIVVGLTVLTVLPLMTPTAP